MTKDVVVYQQTTHDDTVEGILYVMGNPDTGELTVDIDGKTPVNLLADEAARMTAAVNTFVFNHLQSSRKK